MNRNRRDSWRRGDRCADRSPRAPKLAVQHPEAVRVGRIRQAIAVLASFASQASATASRRRVDSSISGFPSSLLDCWYAVLPTRFMSEATDSA